MSSNSCWSTIVQPGVPCKVTFPSGSILNITGFSLDIDSKQLLTASGKIILNMSVNGAKPVTVMSFIVGRYDSSVVNILLGKNESATLTSSGANFPVRVSGCLVNYKPGQKAPAAAATKVSSTAASKVSSTAAKKTPAASAKKTPAPSKNPSAATKNPSTKTPAAVKKAPTAAKKATPTSPTKKPAASKKPTTQKK